jgi:hypothetical protein
LLLLHTKKPRILISHSLNESETKNIDFLLLRTLTATLYSFEIFTLSLFELKNKKLEYWNIW